MNIANVKNRGYFKIKGAASAFDFDFKDKIVLDIGSSTGGFTQYALERGAKKVIAVEKGTGQMKEPLRSDPRVELHEKTDIFDVVPEGDGSVRVPAYDVEDEKVRSQKGMLVKIPTPNVILADISFLSLTKILKYAKDYLSDRNTEFLVMLKPQFEAKPSQLNNGIVKNEKIRREIIKNFESWLKMNKFIVQNKKDNELQGRHGNTERFYYLRLAK